MALYGPRPGDRVCKVNFSRLSEQEKRNTNLLLAKQDHEIVFDEEGDGFVANIKFIKSPNRNLARTRGDNSTSPEKSKSKSPQKADPNSSLSNYPFNVPNLYTNQRAVDRIHYEPHTPEKKKVKHARPAKPPVPTNASLRPDSKSRDKGSLRLPADPNRGRSRSRREADSDAKKPTDSPGRNDKAGDKLDYLKDYQSKFPKNDLSDKTYRPIMIGKKFLTEKIEEIYHYIVDRLIRGQNFLSCGDGVQDFMWHKYQKNTVYFHQGLINLLYSLKRLTRGNEDVAFFDKMVLEEFNFNQFLSFLIYREIFQTVTKITIVGSRPSPKNTKSSRSTPRGSSSISKSLTRCCRSSTGRTPPKLSPLASSAMSCIMAKATCPTTPSWTSSSNSPLRPLVTN
jgi:hypothetical protein